ncbi:TIGR01777 family oxidoreductase [Desertibacillus haloalkaliphilus]|uniref:TIGR01777 family oxidoreductase n=1 Tax=Desertibacillus haloalkaliphilus TaxID=1328930 RepID=UPI001C2583E7|nr:TIGR01777 family oxidoreductase [Desertibacillus haloalkaliphilus]MBU8908876.1 TIGR01777 family oxidoreductase [Desertibacillus haloalkaliphilus]
MNIVIAGGSGFIGSALTERLTENGHHVYILTRSTNKRSSSEKVTYLQWLTDTPFSIEEIGKVDAVINLAGESLNSGRWTKERKQRIVTSRETATRKLIELIKTLDHKPPVFINASAIGYYGFSQDEMFTERTQSDQHDFLATVCKQWEHEASKAEDLGIRTVYARFGLVLDKKNGALPQMLTPYRLCCGGTVGSGRQWLSWIHIEDAVRILEFALTNENIAGPLNLTAPHPEQMKPFGQTIATVLRRPHWLPVPSFALQALLGEMSVLVLKGQKVLPEKALTNGYQFQYPHLKGALQHLLR